MSGIGDILGSLAALLVPSFGAPLPPVYNGYVEADYVYVAATSPGRITELNTQEGAVIEQGAVLLVLEDAGQQAALHVAQAGVAVAQANLENLMTGGRDDEIDSIRAMLRQAEADQSLAQSTAERSNTLFERGLVALAQVDADRARLESQTARVEQLRAQLRVAELPARDAQRLAAEAQLDIARAQVEQALVALDDRTIAAPITGQVDQIYYETGEVAGIGAPIMSIFQPDHLKTIFFIPEGERASFSIGDTLVLQCDACPPTARAHITRMASSPQYTPPIIYSRDERTRLVFRAEAVLDANNGLLPGQPITLSRP